MERRHRQVQFVPSSEGLEGRALLSVASPAAQRATTIRAAVVTPLDPSLPNTIAQKNQRVDRLPFYLNKLQPGRNLPPATIATLQDNLRSIIGQLRPPPRADLEAFNVELRNAMPYLYIRPEDAAGLNRTFGNVLLAAGATQDQTVRLQGDLDELTRANSEEPKSVFLTTNDYSLILQTALGVGKFPKAARAAPRGRG